MDCQDILIAQGAIDRVFSAAHILQESLLCIPLPFTMKPGVKMEVSDMSANTRTLHIAHQSYQKLTAALAKLELLITARIHKVAQQPAILLHWARSDKTSQHIAHE